MLEAISFEGMMKDLREKHSDRSSVTVGILIGNANCEFVRGTILSKINQYHHRSNYNIDFYFPGYGAYWYGHYGFEETVCVVDGIKWLYSDKALFDFIRVLENKSNYQYSGETDLILINYRNGELDFSEVMIFWLDRMYRDEVIYSPANFFEKVFSLFKDRKLVNEASDSLAINGIGECIINMIKEKVSFLGLYDNNKWFCVRNFLKKS
ncbi:MULTISPECIES: hypothetical protein [Clostridium]|uniref:hypothetical protein n=1 Tax=Clostridium TaxID=1485 RepID=UPI0002CB7CDA|nr:MULTISPECIES: hypothetical protein [Clostridium]EMU55645.1 hypothetical protein CBDKU1_03730 [Clostridium butyricum DKU-01]KJZ86091.1 hypothetical protein ClosIBUN125C_CONTIG44g02637 [Clostridium sp. IBUN125C]KJZ88159.1 hypothetical protein ClosIBUN22A_CONTIG4g00130 [Clostridium sp. IBUN22A]KJZ89935.1 hypothetical protein ClosIBUN13A_CONTIG249g03998 [Clostridium sp. IBUN13A]KJZ90425.1 hypothetical protein ClosIBUN62F_CONTIG79g03232 [Clostridium sp. IBUN62F]